MENRDLNMPLRTMVLEETLKIEYLSKEVIKIIVRIFKNNSKTLSHKGSSLSLKNRIDILYDLEEIDDEYNDLIKILEIRNQFTHNSEAISFLSLDKIDDKLNKHLKKAYPKLFTDIKNKDEEEVMLNEAFRLTAYNCQNKLNQLMVEYSTGYRKELKEKFFIKSAVNIKDIIMKSIEGYINNKYDNIGIEKLGNDLAKHIDLALKSEKLNLMSDPNEEVKKAMKPKVPISEIHQKKLAKKNIGLEELNKIN